MKASSIAVTPNDAAKYDDAVYNLLSKLSSNPRNLVYLMSGRRRDQLEYYRDIPHIGICAENGSFLKFADRTSWIPMLPDIDVSWKKPVAEIFEYYTDRTPGSYIEQKETSIVWHLGRADQSFGSWQAAECTNHIQNSLSATYSIHSLAKKRSVEVMPRNVNKGIAARRIIEHHQGRRNTYSSSSVLPQTPGRHRSEQSDIILEDSVSPEYSCMSPQARSMSPPFPSRRGHIDFILSIGDDRQDEYMFEYLNRNLDRHNRSHSMGSEMSAVLTEPTSPLSLEFGLENMSLGTCWADF
jgi:trehalose-phosphatase